jgi:hypothetical protein
VEPAFWVLDELKDDAKRGDVDAFRKRYGDAFLVLDPGVNLEDPLGPRRTMTSQPAYRPGAVDTSRGGLCVYAIAKSDRAPFSHFIAAGRTRNNDVVVLDVSVSKFHALFKKDAGGVYSVQDAGSRNGTWVNDQKVNTQQEGAGTALAPGCTVRLGNVIFTFYTARELHDLARKL